MNKKLTVILSSIVLLALASCGQETSPANQETNTAQEVAVKSEPVTASAYNDFSSAPASYVQYSGQDLSTIGETTVLYFSQESCGTCQKTDADIKAQASLPDNVNIVKVDYDTETELNKQYGVTTKHTFVLVDENGNEIAKEIGLATAADIADFVNSNSNGVQEVAVKSEPVAASAYNDFSSAPASYVQYSGQDLSTIGETTVLYFSQESCGTCQKTDADIKAQASLPDNVNIVKVDYDTETELNKQYGVTTKHTFVLVDENGNEIAKEIGLATAADIADFVNSNTQAETAAVISTTAKTATAAVATEVAVETTPVAASSAGTYKTYNGTVPANSVLFFSASWCPSCVAAEKNFVAEGDLAINTDVIRVDFDSESELKAKYGVTTKHTFVRVDENGDLVSKMVTGQKSSDLLPLFN